MEQVSSFIVHIYQHKDSDAGPLSGDEIVGVVEGVESEIITPFTSPQQLWEILAQKYSTNSPIDRHK